MLVRLELGQSHDPPQRSLMAAPKRPHPGSRGGGPQGVLLPIRDGAASYLLLSGEPADSRGDAGSDHPAGGFAAGVLNRGQLALQGRYNVPSREEVRDLHRQWQSWRKVGNALGVNPAVAYRYAMSDYIPKRSDILEALGRPLPTLVKQYRDQKSGRFAKVSE